MGTRSYNDMLKNVFLLSGMWGMGLGAAFVQIPAAQNVLVENGYSSVSTVPLGLIMLLSSPCAVIIPKLITIFGEKKTFIVASSLGVMGALLQMTGVLISNGDKGSALQMILIMIGASVQSFTYASSNNLRFAVAYFSTPEFLPKASALVLFGGVLSSLLGPLLSNVTRYIIPGAEYAGNFMQIGIMYFLFGILGALADFERPQPRKRKDLPEDTLSLVLVEENETSPGEDTAESPAERPLREILVQTDLPLLTIFQCLSYNIMALYMTQVQLPMISLGYSTNSRTYTITAHMIGMFLPGLVSGHFVNRLGTWATTSAGFLIFLLGGVIMRINDSLPMFIVGMSTIGVGWNLSFVGPSAEVCKIFAPKEKSKVVGFNDGIMLATIGIFALAGSPIYYAIGSWAIFNYMLIGVSAFSALMATLRGLSTRRKSMDDDASVDSFFDQHLFDAL
ncbi:hypothetical protein ACHAWF_008617 [Thalassiosira exigua]